MVAAAPVRQEPKIAEQRIKSPIKQAPTHPVPDRESRKKASEALDTSSLCRALENSANSKDFQLVAVHVQTLIKVFKHIFRYLTPSENFPYEWSIEPSADRFINLSRLFEAGISTIFS